MVAVLGCDVEYMRGRVGHSLGGHWGATGHMRVIDTSIYLDREKRWRAMSGCKSR